MRDDAERALALGTLGARRSNRRARKGPGVHGRQEQQDHHFGGRGRAHTAAGAIPLRPIARALPRSRPKRTRDPIPTYPASAQRAYRACIDLPRTRFTLTRPPTRDAPFEVPLVPQTGGAPMQMRGTVRRVPCDKARAWRRDGSRLMERMWVDFAGDYQRPRSHSRRGWRDCSVRGTRRASLALRLTFVCLRHVWAGECCRYRCLTRRCYSAGGEAAEEHVGRARRGARG